MLFVNLYKDVKHVSLLKSRRKY